MNFSCFGVIHAASVLLLELVVPFGRLFWRGRVALQLRFIRFNTLHLNHDVEVVSRSHDHKSAVAALHPKAERVLLAVWYAAGLGVRTQQPH